MACYKARLSVSLYRLFLHDITKSSCIHKSFEKAGDGNRTHVSSLEGWCSTIELHLHTIYNLHGTIGVTGFEPATSWSQTRRSSQTEPHPEIWNAIILHHQRLLTNARNIV